MKIFSIRTNFCRLYTLHYHSIKRLGGLIPQVIDRIDAIARKKQRAVLYLEFNPAPTFHSQMIETDEDHDLYLESKHRISEYKYEKDSVRDEIIENLN
jgi:hypothetical protein